MTISKINDKDIESLKVASLPSRPTAPTAFGGSGYTAKDMKNAFDRLPLYLVSRFNDLVDSIGDPDGVLDSIPSGLSDGHTLKDLTRDISSGTLATYLTVLGRPLAERILDIGESISRIDLLISTMSSGTSDTDKVLNEFKSRLADVEGNLGELLRHASEIDGHLTALNEQINAELADTEESILFELADCRDMLSDRIDVINSKLEGTIDFAIDCGGPGNL